MKSLESVSKLKQKIPVTALSRLLGRIVCFVYMVVFIRLPMRIKHLNNERGDLETLARRLVVVFVSIRSYNYASVSCVVVWDCTVLRLSWSCVQWPFVSLYLFTVFRSLANILSSKVCDRFTYSTRSFRVILFWVCLFITYHATRGSSYDLRIWM